MSNKVTYADIIEALSEKTGFSKQKSEAFTKALIHQVKKELQETGKASITNFGSFKVKNVAERRGQNPQTGEPITIPAHKRVSFTPYKALKEEVNARYAHLETKLIQEEKGEEAEESTSEKVSPDPSPQQVEKKDESKEVTPEERDDGKDLSSEPEPEPEEKPEAESEKVFEIDQEPEPQAFSPKRAPLNRRKSSNTGLIIVAVLALIVVVFASIWFMMSPDAEESEMATSAGPTSSEQTTAQPGALQEDMNEQAATDSQNEEVKPAEAVVKQDTEPAVKSSATNPETNTYTVKEDEWYWVISREVYGKSHFWPLIFKQNYTVDDHPDSLKKDVRLEIPVLEGSAENPTKEDYQKLAAASKMVSDAYLKYGRNDKAEEYARYARKWDKAGM